MGRAKTHLKHDCCSGWQLWSSSERVPNFHRKFLSLMPVCNDFHWLVLHAYNHIRLKLRRSIRSNIDDYSQESSTTKVNSIDFTRREKSDLTHNIRDKSSSYQWATENEFEKNNTV